MYYTRFKNNLSKKYEETFNDISYYTTTIDRSTLLASPHAPALEWSLAYF
jgi:hypothetical protein